MVNFEIVQVFLNYSFGSFADFMCSDSISEVQNKTMWSVGAEVCGNLGRSSQQRQSLRVPQLQRGVREECDSNLNPKQNNTKLNKQKNLNQGSILPIGQISSLDNLFLELFDLVTNILASFLQLLLILLHSLNQISNVRHNFVHSVN